MGHDVQVRLRVGSSPRHICTVNINQAFNVGTRIGSDDPDHMTQRFPREDSACRKPACWLGPVMQLAWASVRRSRPTCVDKRPSFKRNLTGRTMPRGERGGHVLYTIEARFSRRAMSRAAEWCPPEMAERTCRGKQSPPGEGVGNAAPRRTLYPSMHWTRCMCSVFGPFVDAWEASVHVWCSFNVDRNGGAALPERYMYSVEPDRLPTSPPMPRALGLSSLPHVRVLVCMDHG